MSRKLPLLLLLLPFALFGQNRSEQRHYVVDDTIKYTYSMIVDDLTYLYANFSQWVHPVKVGKSEFGLEMSTVRIGYAKAKKNAVFIVGNIHAREDYSSKFVMKFLNLFLLSLENQSAMYPSAKKILDSLDIYIMPVANPDGLKIAHEDFAGIEDSFARYKDDILLINTYAEWKANGKGIDLNSSFDDGNHALKQAENNCLCAASEGYKGAYPAQAKETKILQHFIDSIRPIMTISFHTKGNILYWADKQTHPWFKNLDTKINKEVAAKSGFVLGTIGKKAAIYSSGLENYARKRLKRFGVCVELSRPIGGGVQHPDNAFNTEVWEKAWMIPEVYLQNAAKYGKQLSAF